MTDEADRADQETERDRAEAMRLRKSTGPEPTGFCRLEGCGEPVAPGARFCPGTFCRDEWQRIQDARARSGARQ